MDNYLRAVLWRAGIYILLGLSLNIIVGYAGLFQLGPRRVLRDRRLHRRHPEPLIRTCPCSWVCRSAIVPGVACGYLHQPADPPPARRLSGDRHDRLRRDRAHAAGQQHLGGITGGANGLSGIAQPALFGFTFCTTLSHYYLVLFFVVVTIFGVRRLEDSRLGPGLDVRARGPGGGRGDGDRHRRGARRWPSCSARLGRAGGRALCQPDTVISPDLVRFLESVIMFCIVVLGGTGSIPGVFVGALGMVALARAIPLRQGLARRLFVGLAMVLMMIFRPTGLWPSRRVAMEIHAEKECRTAATLPAGGSSSPRERRAGMALTGSPIELTKSFGGLMAVSNVDLEIERGRDPGDDRPQRGREDHGLQPAHRHLPARSRQRDRLRRASSSDRPAPPRHRRRRASRAPSRRSGSSRT